MKRRVGGGGDERGRERKRERRGVKEQKKASLLKNHNSIWSSDLAKWSHHQVATFHIQNEDLNSTKIVDNVNIPSSHSQFSACLPKATPYIISGGAVTLFTFELWVSIVTGIHVELAELDKRWFRFLIRLLAARRRPLPFTGSSERHFALCSRIALTSWLFLGESAMLRNRLLWMWWVYKTNSLLTVITSDIGGCRRILFLGLKVPGACRQLAKAFL